MCMENTGVWERGTQNPEGSDFSASGACVQSCKHRVWAFGSSSDDAVSICKINPAPATVFFHKTPHTTIYDGNGMRIPISVILSSVNFAPPPAGQPIDELTRLSTN